MNKETTTKSGKGKVEYKTPKGMLIFILVLILFAFQEIIFRLIFPVPEISNFNRINYSPVFFGSANQELQYLENASFIWASDPDHTESVIKLNMYGFRGKNFKAKPEEGVPRIAFLGDSFTEGYLAEEDESIPMVFQKTAIGKGGEYEVLNLGIGGSDFSTYCNLLRDAISTLSPDHIVIILHANDLPAHKFNQDIFAKPLEPVFNHWWVPRAVYVIKNAIAGKPIPRRWRSKPFTFFAPVPAPSNPWSNTETAKKYNKFISSKVANAMKAGRFNPFSVDEYTNFKEHLQESFQVTEHLNGIQNYAAQFGKKVYIVYIPSRNQVSDYYLKFQKEFSSADSLTSLTLPEYQIHAKIMSESCKSLGIPFFDFTPIVKKAEDSGNHLYWNYDEHMKAKGYKLIGETLYAWWKEAKNSYNDY
ncbi:MAG: SGNH/GDSL hydrolase family protein [bacterium]